MKASETPAGWRAAAWLLERSTDSAFSRDRIKPRDMEHVINAILQAIDGVLAKHTKLREAVFDQIDAIVSGELPDTVNVHSCISPGLSSTMSSTEDSR